MIEQELSIKPITDWDGSYAGLLSTDHCSLLKGAAQEWRSANSKVLSVPALKLSDTQGSLVETGASIVCIAGPSNEPLHYHSSHLVGVVTRGSGWLCVPGLEKASPARLAVSSGDVVVIPKGALHLFDCDPDTELDYVALEVSDGPIDYQKHWKD